MKALYATLLLVVGVLLTPIIYAENDGNIVAVPPQPMPDVPLQIQGTAHSLAEYRGQPLLINLWATWCPPCVAELPSIERLQRRYEGRGLKVLPISFDAGPNTVGQMYGRLGISGLDIIMGEEELVAPALGAGSLPTSVLVDASGKIVARIQGARDWSDASTAMAIEKLLGSGLLRPATPATRPAAPVIRDIRL